MLLLNDLVCVINAILARVNDTHVYFISLMMYVFSVLNYLTRVFESDELYALYQV